MNNHHSVNLKYILFFFYAILFLAFFPSAHGGNDIDIFISGYVSMSKNKYSYVYL